MTRVLRMQPEDRVIVLDDSGWEQEVVLVHLGPDRVVGPVAEKRLAHGEPRTKISLYQSVLKGQRFELVLQKGTELGVVEFVPVISSRCILSGLDDVSRKPSAGSASSWKQRNNPAEADCPACARRSCSHVLVAGPNGSAGSRSFRGKTSTRWFAPGSAPGWRRWATGVRALFHKPVHRAGGRLHRRGNRGGPGYGIVPLGLGPRILRAETAGLAAVSAIFCELGDMDCASSLSNRPRLPFATSPPFSLAACSCARDNLPSKRLHLRVKLIALLTAV